MKKIIFTLILFFVIVSDAISAPPLPTVGTRLNFVSNSSGTLIIDVQAMSNGGDVQINTFQDAFQLDANLRAQISSESNVTFSIQNFPSPDYTSTGTGYRSSDGRVSYVYTFDSGTRGTISGSSWTTVVRVTIVYTITAAQSTVSWFSGIPEYLVTDNNNQNLTGSENSIPSELQDAPLPVELNSFNAKAKGSNVELLWKTATEINNYGFEIERLQNYKNTRLQDSDLQWEKIGFVSANGNSNSPKDYSFTDKNLSGGSRFAYRLKQIDNNGTFSYSDKVEVEVIPDKFELYQNYPNPFNPVTNIKFSLPEAGKIKLDIYNIIGQHITTLVDQNMEAGFYNIPFDAANLATGTYIYRITAQNFSQTKKMLLIK